MKSRDFLHGRQCAVGACFLLILNLLFAGTAFAATTPPGSLLNSDRALLRRRPSDVSPMSAGRQASPHRLARQTLPAGQPGPGVTPVGADPAASQTDFERFVDS